MSDISHVITVTPLPGREAGFPDFVLFEQVVQDQLEPYLIDFAVDRNTDPSTGQRVNFTVSGWSSYDRSLPFAEWLQITTEVYPVTVTLNIEYNDGEGNLNSRATWVGGEQVRYEEARMTDVKLDEAIKVAQRAMKHRGRDSARVNVLESALANLLAVLA